MHHCISLCVTIAHSMIVPTGWSNLCGIDPSANSKSTPAMEVDSLEDPRELLVVNRLQPAPRSLMSFVASGWCITMRWKHNFLVELFKEKTSHFFDIKSPSTLYISLWCFMSHSLAFLLTFLQKLKPFFWAVRTGRESLRSLLAWALKNPQRGNEGET